MALIDNPFDTKTKPVDGPTEPTQPQQPSQGLVAGGMQPDEYNPTTRSVGSQQTVSGQIESILSKGGPMYERARAIAMEDMNSRGLINSSMATGAAYGALIDRALPIAGQDAQTYSSADQDNMAAVNTASQFNTGARNQFKSQASDQSFQTRESALNRAQQTSERIGGEQFQAGQNTINQQFQERILQLQESGQNQRQAQQIASAEMLQKLQEAGIQNRFDIDMAMRDSQFNIEEANKFRMQAAQQAAALEQIGLQNKLATAQVPAQFAAAMANNVTGQVGAIMADPNLTPEAKRVAIENWVTYANETMSWGEKFYGV
jgi:hypothetical protein